MPNTYTQLFIQYIFAVHHRRSLIKETWQDKLYKYISGIITEQGHKLYIINGVPDHVHILISMSPTQTPSELMYNVKRSSSLWINENKLVTGRFSWQEGFGAFSLGKTQLKDKIRYIEQQQDFDEKYIFKPIE
jgi:putative transposase